MTKTATLPQSISTQEPCEYLPIKEFLENMGRTEDDNPYSSTFSFAPFVEKMKENKRVMKQAIEAIDDSFMDQVEKNLLSYLDPEKLDTPEKRQNVMAMLFPSLFFEGQLGFVAKPFTREFFFMTPALQEIFTSNDWELKLSDKLTHGKMGSPAIEAGKLILKNFYGQTFDSNSYQTMTFRHKEDMLERHFQINIVLDHVKATPLKPIEELSQGQIHRLLDEWDNEAHWLKQFPPDHFLFEGLVIGYIQDVTEVEVLSRMKEMMLTDHEEDIGDSELIRQQLNSLICSYLRMPDLVFGSVLNRDFKYAHLVSWSVIGGLDVLAPFSQEDFVQSPSYGKVLAGQESVIIGDLQTLESPSKIETILLEKGYRSLLLAPQKNNQGEIIGIMELASPQAYCFNNQILDKLGEIISLYTIGSNRWIQMLDNNINFFIQEQFTYIHPSVEWKFQEVSQKYLLAATESGEPPVLEQIGFKNVYPLYGQADIVGSSKIRNSSIEADMLDNLQRVQKVIKAYRKRIPFQLLDIYLAKTEEFSERLENGGYVSSDESQIVELLVEGIHPLLRELTDKFDKKQKGALSKVLKKYVDYLDPKLDIVYRQRKDYEDSVHALNELIANYVDKEVAKKQEVLPHFFEKYVTDGVEYNIYLGQSLLPKGNFSHYFLEDFRLWQLLLMCEVTKLVEKNKSKFLVPLSTAQLIFVYNTPLSICFNMDEKQFDVDGAYNVRYEILKKRIDKAVIKGTKERLTQKGKIAIVWLQEKDRIEYLEYLNHLLDQGYITDDIEDLELERLQGADGLRALRVTVVV